jgi:pullulanase
MKVFLLFLFLYSLSAFGKGQFYLFSKGISDGFSSHLRDIYVYIPDGYEKSKVRYPVLYMHDGQNLFDPERAYSGQTWRATETLNYLIQEKIISPLIVVAIDNTPGRMEDYIPEKKGKEYLNFLVNRIKPRIDDSLRTKKTSKDTGILGSSLGGLISLYAGITHPETFSIVGAMSPSIWWNDRSILKMYEQSSVLPLKIYLDSGTTGGEEPRDVLDLEEILLGREFRQNDNLFTFIQNGADHQEYYWSQRLPLALKSLFPHKPQ